MSIMTCDLEHIDQVHVPYTSSCYGGHLCYVIWKSSRVGRYAPEKKIPNKFFIWPWPVNLTLDIYLIYICGTYICDTPAGYGAHLCQVIWKSNKECGSYALETNFHLTLACDLDLLCADLAHINDSLSCYGKHLCQVLWKSSKGCGNK